MNIHKLSASLLLFPLLCIPLLLPQPAEARVITGKTTAVVNEDEVIGEDLFIAAESVTINGTVEGDVYAAGGSVEINGTVTGDVLAAGGNLILSGSVGQDVRAAGGSILVNNAEIAKGATLAGGSITIDSESSIGGSLLTAGGNITNRAPIGRDLLIGAGSAVINAPVQGEVLAGVESLQIGPNASIAGDLSYPTSADTNISPAASISGTIKEVLSKGTEDLSKPARDLGAAWSGAHTGLKIWSYLSAMVVGALLLYFLPKVSTGVADTLSERPLASVLWGFVAFLLVGPLFFMLLFTILGIPLAFLLLLFFFIDLYLTKLVVGLALGQWLTGRFGWGLSLFLTLALGLGVYYLLQLVPILSFFVSFLGTLAGLGAIVVYKARLLPSRK
jgi:cytoskeletal protein CcmA (bactofilin family)